MAPKILSTSLSSHSFLSPLSLLNQLTNSNPNSLRFCRSKYNLIVCKSIKSNTHENTPHSEAHVSISAPEADGAGAAAPTRGEIFLERQQSLSASAVVLAVNKKKKKKREKLTGSLKVSTLAPSCYGCGAPLQTLEVEAPGYVDPETYEVVQNLSGFQ